MRGREEVGAQRRGKDVEKEEEGDSRRITDLGASQFPLQLECPPINITSSLTTIY